MTWLASTKVQAGNHIMVKGADGTKEAEVLHVEIENQFVTYFTESGYAEVSVDQLICVSPYDTLMGIERDIVKYDENAPRFAKRTYPLKDAKYVCQVGDIYRTQLDGDYWEVLEVISQHEINDTQEIVQTLRVKKF